MVCRQTEIIDLTGHCAEEASTKCEILSKYLMTHKNYGVPSCTIFKKKKSYVNFISLSQLSATNPTNIMVLSTKMFAPQLLIEPK